MSSYQVPETTSERISDFDNLFEEFKREYMLLTEKQKKVSGHRARKALLSMAKLTRHLRKDIQDSLGTINKTETKEKSEE